MPTLFKFVAPFARLLPVAQEQRTVAAASSYVLGAEAFLTAVSELAKPTPWSPQ